MAGWGLWEKIMDIVLSPVVQFFFYITFFFGVGLLLYFAHTRLRLEKEIGLRNELLMQVNEELYARFDCKIKITISNPERGTIELISYRESANGSSIARFNSEMTSYQEFTSSKVTTIA